MKRIDLVVGARPNFIKAFPVYRALEELECFKLRLINTGQHYDENMVAVFFKQLKMKEPDINLGIGSGRHGEQIGRILTAIEEVFIDSRPDLVMVFGDVNSTIAAALAAVKLHISVAHVEAGLRSFDRTMPEEINRVLTDQISEFLFTTCQDADFNLINEGIAKEKIHFVGNTMIDSLVAFEDHFSASKIHEKLNINDPYALMTFHRPSNVDDKSKLTKLISSLEETTDMIMCIFPVHPRTKNKLKNYGLLDQLDSNPRFHLLAPIGYIDFMRLQRDASVVLTDWGGIHEEATYFGVPCLTVRENTERPITIEHGTNKKIGNGYDNIPGEVRAAVKRKKIIQFLNSGMAMLQIEFQRL